MEIRINDIDRVFNSVDNLKPNAVYEVGLECIYDAGLNPREIDVKYAEEISFNIPPIVVGIILDSDLKKFAIIDGNHRYYNRSQVEKSETIPSFIRIYKNETEAFIDAYKANLEHGKRLTDREELKGMQRIIGYLKAENPNITLVKIAEIVNISHQRVSEYLNWIEVNKTLGKEIVKSKAQKLSFMLKKSDNGETLKKFWELNSNLSKSDLMKAIKHYKQEEKVVDYASIKIKNILENDSFDDGLRIKKDEKIPTLSHTIIMDNKNNFIEQNTKHEKEISRFENLSDYPEYEDEFIKDTKYEEPIKINNIIKNNENENYEENKYIENEIIPEQSIPLSKSKDLVALEGYNRFYKFETIAKRYFENMTEEILTNTEEFKNLVNNNINNNNMESYNKLKPELRGMIKNIESVLKDLQGFIA